MKYIRTENLGFVIFQDHIEHLQMARRVMSATDQILSAGMIRSKDGGICYGKSVSLGKIALKEDSEAFTLLNKVPT
jgi:hypothetical protein